MSERAEPRLILATFDDQGAADEGLARIVQAVKEKRVGVRAAAVVSQGGGSRVRVSNVSEFRAGQAESLLRFVRLWNGAIIVSVKAAGAVVSSLTALAILGAVRAVGVADMALGRLAGLAGRSPLHGDQLRDLGQHLPAGSTAVVTLTDAESAEDVRRLMEQSGAQVYTSAVNGNLPGPGR